MKSRKPGNEGSPVRPRAAAPLARSKPPVMNATFDHLYACHLEQAVTERPRISPATEKSLTQRLNRCSKENRMLRNLLLVNLDLVQQQSDRLVNKDKTLLALKRENASLKSRIDRIHHMNRGSNSSMSSLLSSPPSTSSLNMVSCTQTSATITKPSTSQVSLNKYTELLITDNPSSAATTIVDPNMDKSKDYSFLPTEGEYLHIPEIVTGNLSDNKSNFFYPKDEFLLDVTSLDNEAELKAKDTSFGKEATAAERLKETISRETITREPLSRDSVPPPLPTKKREGVKYRTVGGLRTQVTFPRPPLNKARAPPKASPLKLRQSTLKAKAESMFQSQFYKSRNSQQKTSSENAKSKNYDSSLTVNKKSKMIHTYGKSSKRESTDNGRGMFGSTKKYPYTGSLSERLKLIDTTPTGEDPYQLGEADMREQSPIPRLTHPNKTKFCSENYTGTSEALKHLDSSIIGENREGKAITKIKLNKYNYGTPFMFPGENEDDDDSSFEDKMDMDFSVANSITELANVETQADLKGDKVEASVCDFSYGENSRNIASRITFENDDYENVFSNSSYSTTYNQGLSYLLNSTNNDSQENKTIGKRKSAPTSSKSLLKKKATPFQSTRCAPRSKLPNKGDISLKPRPNRSTSRPLESGSEPRSNSISRIQTDPGSKQGSNNTSRTPFEMGSKARTDSTSSRPHSDMSEPAPSTTFDLGTNLSELICSSVGATFGIAASNPIGPGPGLGAAKNKGKGKGKVALKIPKKKVVSGKRTPPPPMMTRGGYHTTVGDADSSWFLGRDPDEPDENLPGLSESKQKSIEVPRWREKVYTPLYSMEGTENLDDEIFARRHQKGEKEEKRLKRWDLQRQREQVVVERLRRRQQDAPWYNRGGAGSGEARPPHTLDRRHKCDVHTIEIVDEIPVSAFGESVLALPDSDFYLPWVRSCHEEHRKEKKKA